ncbi:sugar transferase [Tropicimonas isoalkanivorans]|uniref:Sugar transferase involved in LPS biosynthesis (Colanic, teichoic acid) n=1 Tax=Tropicimonas isoalkanivorans TaxID=441112 RepID=A0A1I1LL48_9RHOB|nr:sugar transferase [Tropicimonas isoalkanivorans]SFC73751.1 Sugar transferase involved in LPS biosynthesis (colanic, teichoic acid) [Tropicimonas isoalkanivorans]
MTTHITNFIPPGHDLTGFTEATDASGRRVGRYLISAGLSLGIADVVAIFAAVKGLGLVAPDLAENHAVQPALILAAAIQIGLKAFQGMYPGYGLHHDAALKRGARAWCGAVSIAAIAAMLFVDANSPALTAIALTFVVAGILQIVFASGTRLALTWAGLWGQKVHLRGDAQRVDALQHHLTSDRRLGLRPVPLHQKASVLLWAGDAATDPTALARLKNTYADVILVSDLPKVSLSGFHNSHHGGEIGLRLSRQGASTGGTILKRIFDLVLTVPIVIAALPILVLAAIAIRLTDPGPIFYTQVREGLGGRKIRILKLRTMYRDADRLLAELLERDPEARAEWNTHFKLRNDPRILPVVGTLLREFSLDELPQVFNVILGDMSLVGPRPFPEYHLAAMCPEFRARRASVVPGLTGIWQISDRSQADVALQEQLDGYYLNNRSFWLDVSILYRTVGAVFGRNGAY